MKLVYVKWEDCRMDTNAPMYPVQAKPPIIGESAGWLIKEDDRAVYLCMDVFEKEETESEASVRHVVTIPRRQIIEHRVFELPEDEATKILKEACEEVVLTGKHPFKIYTAGNGQAVETPVVPYMEFTEAEKEALKGPGVVQAVPPRYYDNGETLVPRQNGRSADDDTILFRGTKAELDAFEKEHPSVNVRKMAGTFIPEEEMRAKWAASCVEAVKGGLTCGKAAQPKEEYAMGAALIGLHRKLNATPEELEKMFEAEAKEKALDASMMPKFGNVDD